MAELKPLTAQYSHRIRSNMDRRRPLIHVQSPKNVQYRIIPSIQKRPQHLRLRPRLILILPKPLQLDQQRTNQRSTRPDIKTKEQIHQTLRSSNIKIIQR